jgi:hypothetical protein
LVIAGWNTFLLRRAKIRRPHADFTSASAKQSQWPTFFRPLIAIEIMSSLPVNTLYLSTQKLCGTCHAVTNVKLLLRCCAKRGLFQPHTKARVINIEAAFWEMPSQVDTFPELALSGLMLNDTNTTSSRALRELGIAFFEALVSTSLVLSVGADATISHSVEFIGLPGITMRSGELRSNHLPSDQELNEIS